MACAYSVGASEKSMSVFGISSRRGSLWPPYCQLGRGFAATSNVVSSVAWQRPDYGRTMVSICWRRPIRLENRMAKSATLSLASYLGLVPPRLRLPDSARSTMQKATYPATQSHRSDPRKRRDHC